MARKLGMHSKEGLIQHEIAQGFIGKCYGGRRFLMGDNSKK